MRFALLLFGVAGAAAGAIAASQPAVLAPVAGGLWLLDGLPGSRTSVQRCVAHPLDLVTVEHGGANCAITVLGEHGANVRASYQCGAVGFGQASIKVITPRSLRIEVSGISDGAPFGYVVQARRVGDCKQGPERGH